MGTELDLEKSKSSQKEFQTLLNKDFENRKLKENSIIKATVTEITKNFVVVDCKAKMEGMIPVEEFKNEIGNALRFINNIWASEEKLPKNKDLDPKSPIEKEVLQWFKQTPVYLENKNKVELKSQLNIQEELAQMLVNRGVQTFSQAEQFFRPSEKDFLNPFKMLGMYKAVE